MMCTLYLNKLECIFNLHYNTNIKMNNYKYIFFRFKSSFYLKKKKKNLNNYICNHIISLFFILNIRVKQISLRVLLTTTITIIIDVFTYMNHEDVSIYFKEQNIKFLLDID